MKPKTKVLISRIIVILLVVAMIAGVIASFFQHVTRGFY